MKNHTGTRNFITICICLLFCSFVIGYELYARQQAQAIIHQHARFIANAVWNVNHQGTAEYLKVAAESQNYRSLAVINNDGEIFRQVTRENHSALQNILEKLELTPETYLSADIRHHDETIGKIGAIWVSYTIYTHINVFFALAMLTTILHLYLRVIGDKAILEEHVAARTAELAQSNRSLLMEIHQKRKTTASFRKSEAEYRKLYKESKKAEEVYRSLIHSSADAILIYDLGMKVEYISAAFTHIFGWSLEDVKGKTLAFSAESEQETIETIFTDLRHDGISCNAFETKGISQDGDILDISISASRFNDHTGQPTGILVALRDISDRTKLEKQLQQADRMEAIGTLAGGIAHDFNNLLMGIQGNISLALLDVPHESPLGEKLTTISSYVKSGEKLTRQLLGFARGGKYEVQPTDINRLLDSENQMFIRTRKEITIHETYQENIWSVEIDRGQIRQVLLNLYVNASQAMPEGGDIYITTRNITLGNTHTRPYAITPGKYVQITVTDTGIGMKKQTLEKIFNPFFTTKEMGRGTGLGLASVYGIIKNHNGFIDVYSEIGEGTTFHLNLPVSDKEVLTKKVAPVEFTPGGGTILLVDDEQMILDVGAEMLKAIGYKAYTASSGDEACEFYAKNSGIIDMVILDMVMPDMDGGKIFDKLKGMNSAVKVLLSSGYSINSKASKIIDRGCDGFLQKPFDINTLSTKVQEVLKIERGQVS